MTSQQDVSEHPNATRIRELFAAFHARDIDSIRNAISESAVWHFPGRSGQLAGSHSGHAGIFAFLARVSELTEGTFELDLEEVLANDRCALGLPARQARRAAVDAQGHARGADGVPAARRCALAAARLRAPDRGHASEQAVLARRRAGARLTRSEPDDDINYTVLALQLMEDHGLELDTANVARAWLRCLPVAWTFTAERAAFKVLLAKANDFFAFGAEPGFDLAECSDNEWNDWIGAQIRADLYGWVCPAAPHWRPTWPAATPRSRIARRASTAQHSWPRSGAAIPEATSLEVAVETALGEIPVTPTAPRRYGWAASRPGATTATRRSASATRACRPCTRSTIWLWSSGRCSRIRDDFGAAVGEVVAAGWIRTATAPRWAGSGGFRASRSQRRGLCRGRDASRSPWRVSGSSISKVWWNAPWR